MAKRKKKKQKPKVIVHAIENGAICSICGRIDNPFIDGICDFHTHGLKEGYGHTEFQLIIHYPREELFDILMRFADCVREGRRFHDGEFIEGIFFDCPVRLTLTKDQFGEDVFRIIIPDSRNRWPEDKVCEYPYCAQLMPLAFMRRGDNQHTH